MTDGTSVGKIQLDVEVNQGSLNTEINKLGKVFSNGFNSNFKGMFNGMSNQMNGFVKDSIGKINSVSVKVCPEVLGSQLNQVHAV